MPTPGDESTEVTRLREKELQLQKNGQNKNCQAKNLEMGLRSKYMTTAVIYYCNISLGMSLTFLGSALIDFKTKFGVDTQAISFVFTTSMICALVSTIAWGIIFNHVNRHALVATLMTVTSVLIGVLPYSSSLTVFFILNGIIAICSSSYLTAQVVWIIEIWKGESRFIQAQHFAYSVGCLFPPLIFAPFLQSESESGEGSARDLILNSMVTMTTPFSIQQNGTEIIPIDPQTGTTRVAIPCAIVGSISLLGSILLFILLCVLPKSSSSKNFPSKPDGVSSLASDTLASENGVADKFLTETNKDEQKVDEVDAPVGRKYLRILLIALAAMFVGCFTSQEASSMGFIPTFAHSTSLKMSAADGARLLFGYNLAYTCGRLGGILLSSVKGGVRPQIILCGNLILAVLGNFVLLIWGKDLVNLMWIGCILLGLAFSTGVPSVYAYVQNHLEVSNVVGSIMMVSGGVLSAVYPLIVGSFIDTLPVVLTYTNFFSVALGSFAFLMFASLTKRFGGKL